MTTRFPGGVVVRDATTRDIEHIADYNCRLAIETENKTLDRDTLVNGVTEGLRRPELCRYFMAEVDGNPAGTTMVTYEFTDWRKGVIWWLQSVYVPIEYRKRGVFTAIYRHIETLARNHPEVRALRLYVRSDNHRAIETYKAMGMVHAGYEVFETDWSEAV